MQSVFTKNPASLPGWFKDVLLDIRSQLKSKEALDSFTGRGLMVFKSNATKTEGSVYLDSTKSQNVHILATKVDDKGNPEPVAFSLKWETFMQPATQGERSAENIPR